MASGWGRQRSIVYRGRAATLHRGKKKKKARPSSYRKKKTRSAKKVKERRGTVQKNVSHSVIAPEKKKQPIIYRWGKKETNGGGKSKSGQPLERRRGKANIGLRRNFQNVGKRKT